MNCILTFALATSLMSASVMDAPSRAAPGMRTRTEPALGCLLGFASGRCRHEFFEPMVRTGPVRDCAKEYLGQGNCPNGYLVAVNYLGTNAKGNDVYHVKFRHADYAYIFEPPGPDGKINMVWITGSPYGITPSWMVDVPPDRSQKIAMYRRPWH
jgi:hypothetical protein